MAGTAVILNQSSITGGGEALQNKATRDLLAWVVEELKNIRKSLGAASGGAGAGILVGSATWDAGNLAADTQESKDVTVTGAALGDFAIASIGVDNVDVQLTACVSATDTVTATLSNATGGAVDLASTTLRVLVIPKAAVAMAAMTLTSPTVSTPAQS